MIKLFFSYRALESAKVDPIRSQLSALKSVNGQPLYQVWIDKANITSADDWWDAIVDAIIDCEFFVFMVSRESIVNPNCLAELDYAYRRNRPIIPVVLEGEYIWDAVRNKPDIEFMDKIPQILQELRAQFLFYQGALFFTQIEAAIQKFKSEPEVWEDLNVPRPPDPRKGEAGNDATTLYNQACDAALRSDFKEAERLFKRISRMKDRHAKESREWVRLLLEYQEIIQYDSFEHTRYLVKETWEKYRAKFPKPFVELFDPKEYRKRFETLTPSALGSQGFMPSVANPTLEPSREWGDTKITDETRQKFAVAQTAVLDIRQKFETGQITQNKMYDAMRNQLILDDNGRSWMIDVHTGKWHVYEPYEDKWVSETPPTNTKGIARMKKR